MAKSVIIPKLEDSSKLPGSQVAEGLKVKLSEAGHLGKETVETKGGSECGRQAEVDPVLWYRQVKSAHCPLGGLSPWVSQGCHCRKRALSSGVGLVPIVKGLYDFPCWLGATEGNMESLGKG